MVERTRLRPALKVPVNQVQSPGGLPSRAQQPLRKRVVLLAEPIATSQLSPCGDAQLWYTEQDYLRFEAEADASPQPIIRGIGICAVANSQLPGLAAQGQPCMSPLCGGHRKALAVLPASQNRTVPRPTVVTALKQFAQTATFACSDLPACAWREGDEPKATRDGPSSPMRQSPVAKPPSRSPCRSPRVISSGSLKGGFSHLTMDELKLKIRETACRRRERQSRALVVVASLIRT